MEALSLAVLVLAVILLLYLFPEIGSALRRTAVTLAVLGGGIVIGILLSREKKGIYGGYDHEAAMEETGDGNLQRDEDEVETLSADLEELGEGTLKDAQEESDLTGTDSVSTGELGAYIVEIPETK